MLGIPGEKSLIWARDCAVASVFAWIAIYFLIPNQTFLSSVVKTGLFYLILYLVGTAVLWRAYKRARVDSGKQKH